jgi:alpha-ketoglutarate-dependent 2,4-dichlorophenoxyacetate dioxygenase
MPLICEPILPEFGAICSGLDLTRPLSPGDVRQITDAMDRFGVTIWRDTGLDDAGHVAFSRNFGYLERVPQRADGARMRLPLRELFDASNLNLDGEITSDPAAVEYRKGDRLWHTDSAFLDKRTSYSILLAHITPPPGAGGETWFADTRTAYDDLPAETKALIEGKVGINSLWWSRKQAGADVSEEEILERPMARHPIVHTHAGSGRKSLFIAAHTMDIEAMEKGEGRQLIADLIAHATQDKYTFKWQWRPGDMVIWDNLCTMHRGGDYDYTAHKRDMRRTTVREGTEPHTMDSGDDPYTALFSRSPKAVDINAARDAGR